MKVIFHSEDFVSVEYAGLGFGNRHPAVKEWHYVGKVDNPRWQGEFECSWDESTKPAQLLWIIKGDERLFALALALKSQGFIVTVKQDHEN